MLIQIAIVLLLLTPVAMLVVRLVRPNFAYFWLIAAGCTLAVWPLVLMAGLRLPQTIPLISWKPEALFSGSPLLLVDSFSWPYALATVSLAAAVILTAVARMPRISWYAWANSLASAGFGLLAVLAGNPLTLLLAWAALDCFELLVLLMQDSTSSGRERAVIAFSARTGGIILLVWGDVLGSAPGQDVRFEAIPSQVNVYLLLAASLRLGVLPMHLPFSKEQQLRRGLGTMMRLTSAAGSLVLLTRTAVEGVPSELVPYLLALAGFSAVYSAVSWATAPDELNGRPYWILSLASLSVAAAVLAKPAASLAWGSTLIFSGGVLFLMSARHRNLTPVWVIGLVGFLALPFTPAWEGMFLYSPPYSVWQITFFVAHAFLILGYLKHIFRPSEPLTGTERWVWVIYPLGLVLLPAGHILTKMKIQPDLSTMPPAGWFGSLLTIGLAALIWILSRQQWELPSGFRPVLEAVFSLDWLYRLFWSVYRSTGRLVSWITMILEGEGGVLWALVLLAILFSVFSLRG